MGLLYASAKIVQLSLVAAKNSLHLQQLKTASICSTTLRRCAVPLRHASEVQTCHDRAVQGRVNMR